MSIKSLAKSIYLDSKDLKLQSKLENQGKNIGSKIGSLIGYYFGYCIERTVNSIDYILNINIHKRNVNIKKAN